ncbi:MAG: hypothetical protein F4Z73_10465 [Synechococcus sp. SB0668_bin_13]|nr:hypothetical protein [Cyanobacteria bacterium MAG IRC3_bin_20]MXW13237.1 hypothetical protein [Synechococcus sp. SB0668_bin_13]MYG65026.1 hypothetical protein [Synechococcus sp. SB0675_bin_7]
MLLHTTSAAGQDLQSSEGSVSRLHLGLAATRPIPLSNGASLTPSLKLGMRQDGGDAETGFGLEVGAGIRWHDPGRGISAELHGRTLLAHGEEECLALSFSWQPHPSHRGPSLSLSHSMGAVTAGGMAALLLPRHQQRATAVCSRVGLRPPRLQQPPHPHPGAGTGPLSRQHYLSIACSGHWPPMHNKPRPNPGNSPSRLNDTKATPPPPQNIPSSYASLSSSDGLGQRGSPKRGVSPGVP